MPSPFPGMNPFLEHEDPWHDFHERFIPAAAAMLTPQVRPGYIVKIDEHVYLHEQSLDQRRLVGLGDVNVSRSPFGQGTSTGTALATAPAYARLPLPVEEVRESFIEVRDRHDRALITVVELLSPSNKRPGGDREQYLAKRKQLLATGVHLVEIDLLRGGPRMPMEDAPPCDYLVMVSRAEERPRVGIWPIGLRDPLPTVPVPLRPPDGDAHLDLQALLHRIYDDAGYEDYIYGGTPVPPLAGEDAAWAAGLVGHR